jgi:hypothetical protein
MSIESNEPGLPRPIGQGRGGGDTPVEIARLQAEIMGRLSPDRRTREALRMSGELLRRRQAAMLEECGGDRNAMLVRFVSLHFGEALARAFAAHRRGAAP